MNPTNMPNTQVKNVFKLRIALSGLCNYRCVFCHNEGRGDEYKKQFLSLKEVERICEGAYLAGIRSFTFTGGEPLSNPNAKTIIHSIRGNFPDTILKLTSNIVLLKEDDIDFLNYNINRVRINFQSTNKGDFERIVGIDRFEKLFRLIELMKKTDVHICLNYVYNDLSKDLLPSIVEYADKNDLEMKVLEMIKYSYNFRFYAPIQNAKDYLESVSIKREKDYQNDDLYYLREGGKKIRLCYSHCNTNNGLDCRTLGELRVSPTMDIYHCLHEGGELETISKDSTVEDIRDAILAIDDVKGNCPRYQPWID